MPMDKIAQALDDFLKQQGGTNRLVLGVEHNETEALSFKVISDPQVAKVLQKRSMQTIGIEAPVVLQDEVDKLAHSTEQTPESFADSIAKKYAELGFGPDSLEGIKRKYIDQGTDIKKQDALGNVVLFYDNPDLNLAQRSEQIAKSHVFVRQANEAMMEKTMDLAIPAMQSLNKAGIAETAERSARLEGQLTGQIYKNDPEVSALDKAFKDSRVAEIDEDKRAKHILDNKTSEGFVVLAGESHGSGKNDLDEKLGAARLVVTKDRNDFVGVSQRFYAQGDEKPGGFLILSEGKIVSGSDAYGAAQKFEQTLVNAMQGRQVEQATDKPAVSAQSALQR